MYLEFFQLNERPFNVTPDPHFLYMSPSHQEAFATLLYGVQERKGFIMITGEVGTGKTTLLHNLLAELDDEVQSVFIFHTGMDFLDLLETIHHELGLPVTVRSKAALLQSLNQHLISLLEQGRNFILIIDEAQNLSPEVLENLRLLSNLETAKEKLLQIVLVGQLELEQKMNLPALRQLAQRVTVQSRLQPLSPEESRAYVRHRLQVAGAGERETPAFSHDALNQVCHAAQGIPRQLNVFCDNAMLIAYAEGEEQVKTQHIREVLKDRELSTLRRPTARPETAERPREDIAPEARRPRSGLRFGALLAALIAVSILIWAGLRLFPRAELDDQRPGEKEIIAALLEEDRPPAENPSAMEPRDLALLASDSAIGSHVPLAEFNAEENSSAPPPNIDLTAAADPAPSPAALLDELMPEAVELETSQPVLVIPEEILAVATAPQAVTQDASSPRAVPELTARSEDGGSDTVSRAESTRLREVRWIEFPGAKAPASAPEIAPSSADGAIPAPLRENFLQATERAELEALLDRSSRKAYTVRRGDSFGDIILAVTGRSDSLVQGLLQDINPHIRDFDHIEPGWIVYLPDLEDGTR